MARETILAREGKVNPINALKSGQRPNDDDRRKNLRDNYETVVKDLSRYYGDMRNVEYGYSFDGSDSNGNPVSGTMVRFTDSRGNWGREAYFSDDGFIVRKSSAPGRNTSTFTKLSAYKMSNKVKK